MHNCTGVIGGVGSGQFLAAKKSYLSAMIALHPSPSVGLHASLYHAQHKAVYMTQLLLLGKVEYGGGPIFKVVLEC